MPLPPFFLWFSIWLGPFDETRPLHGHLNILLNCAWVKLGWALSGQHPFLALYLAGGGSPCFSVSAIFLKAACEALRKGRKTTEGKPEEVRQLLRGSRDTPSHAPLLRPQSAPPSSLGDAVTLCSCRHLETALKPTSLGAVEGATLPSVAVLAGKDAAATSPRCCHRITAKGPSIKSRCCSPAETQSQFEACRQGLWAQHRRLTVAPGKRDDI